MSGGSSGQAGGGGWTKPVAAILVVLVALLIFFALGGIGLISDLDRGLTAASCADSTTPAPPAHYDEQLYMIQGASSGSIDYDLQAVIQFDANGYGPAYLVNGLTSVGYWYQVGIAYDWQCTGGHLDGFYFVDEVWNPSGQAVVGPTEIALAVHADDEVNISLEFVGPDVVMSAEDVSDGFGQSQTYPAEGASSFEGGASSDPAEPGWFTGVMTEWYHVDPYYGGEAAVNYTAVSPLAGNSSSSVTLVIDEQQVPGGVVFADTDAVLVAGPFSTPFSYENANETVSSTAFVTGGG